MKTAMLWSKPPTKKHQRIYDTLKKWWEDGCFDAPFARCVEVKFTIVRDMEAVLLTVYSKERAYHISVQEDYLGATYTMRAPNPSEDHTRGRDLADGDFTKKTWDRIMTDIVANEVIDIAKEMMDNPDWQKAQGIKPQCMGGPGLEGVDTKKFLVAKELLAVAKLLSNGRKPRCLHRG